MVVPGQVVSPSHIHTIYGVLGISQLLLLRRSSHSSSLKGGSFTFQLYPSDESRLLCPTLSAQRGPKLLLRHY